MTSQDRFGYEWNKFNKIIPDYETQFLKWLFPMKPKDFKGKKVIDAGCGVGRNSYWPLCYGAKELLAFDYDKKTVDVAKKNLSKFRNAKVEFSSIYDIKYKNYFDIAFSIEVIHHLEDPDLAINNLIKSIKKGGIVLVWVYGYEGNEKIVKYINPIRLSITSKLSPALVNFLAYFISIPFFIFLKLVPQKLPYLKQLSKFRFWHVHSIIFDQLIPKVANYWKKDEAIELLKNKGLRDINIFNVNNNSWTVIGKKV